MIPALAIVLALLAVQGGQSPAAPDDGVYLPDVQVDPDAITRGQTTTVVVTGADLATLKTLKIEPADGLRVGTVTSLAARPNGDQPVSVAVTVDAAASAGDRSVTMMVALKGAKPGARPAIVAKIHINAHDVKIQGLEAVPADGVLRLRVVAIDEQSDIGRAGQDSSAPIDLEDALDAQVRCGQRLIDTFARDTTIESRQGTTLLLATSLDQTAFASRKGCEVRARVQDRNGNASRWVSEALESP